MVKDLIVFDMDGVLVEVTESSQGVSFEYITVEHPEVLRLTSDVRQNYDWLSAALKTKIQIIP